MKITLPTSRNFFQNLDISFFSEIQSSRILSSPDQNIKAGSDHEYRLHLRKRLSEHLILCGETQLDSSIMDLAQLPQQQGWSFSLSHCPRGSAFAALAKPNLQVGIDVEAIDRLSPSIIDRITKPLEQNSCPKPLHLFSAKESAWKALNEDYSLPTLSHFEIVSWSTLHKDWFGFKVQLNDQVLDGQGFSTEIGPVCMALYLQN